LFRPNLTKIINFIQLAEFGAVDPDITFIFDPLWTMNEKERAEVRKLDAETDQINIDAGVVSPLEVRTRIAADPESPYDSARRRRRAGSLG